METRRSEWEEYMESPVEKLMAMDLKKYNNLITSGRWCTKDPKDAQILTPVVLDQKLVDDSKKTSEKSNREPTKGESYYIRDIPP